MKKNRNGFFIPKRNIDIFIIGKEATELYLNAIK